MKASKQKPVYSVFLVDGDTKYDLTPVLLSLRLYDADKQLAQSAEIGLLNILVEGKWLAGITQVRQRVFIYADDGEKKEEVFRGVVWTRSYTSSIEEREILLKCYDSMIYLQESEESAFIPEGTSTKDAVQTLCDNWGVTLDYQYESITHSKLVLRGSLSNILLSDILDLVKQRTGKKFVLHSDKDVLQVKEVGQNETVYRIEAKKNSTKAKSECTMEGMVTKVVILGKADEENRLPIEATVEGETSRYGTLQTIINRAENTALEDAQKEAEGILAEKGKPFWSYEVEGPDVPWIRKGDKVYVSTGDIYDKTLIVKSVSRDFEGEDATMTLTMEDPI